MTTLITTGKNPVHPVFTAFCTIKPADANPDDTLLGRFYIQYNLPGLLKRNLRLLN